MFLFLLIALTVTIAVFTGHAEWSLGIFLYFPLSLAFPSTDKFVSPTWSGYLAWITPAALLASLMIGIHGMVTSEWISIQGVVMGQPLELIMLGVVILSFFGVHLIIYEIVRSQVIYISVRERLVFYALTITIMVLALSSDFETSGIALLCGCIYFLLMDLFADMRHPGITWSVVWMIVVGSFITLTVFHTELRSSMPYRDDIPLLNAFSFFSYTFILCALFMLILALVNGKINLLPLSWDFNFSHRRQLRNRIQLAILLTLLFSFVGIGVVSVYHVQLSGQLSTTFIQALLNTYVFLFLIGFAISMSLAEYIRNPLIELGNTLKAVKLNKDNEKIKWDSNDEIGNLINEYNHMIDKLQDNAILLARTERDSAWREMAKQVAHEIKNPLTPMKLSLQHLQNTIRLRPEETEVVTLRMCETLMNQIENLRQIADEFSSFGSLPKANNERILLNDIVETIHDLFRKREDMDINLIEPIDDLGVYADKNHLLRVLNNLVKNSMQSIPEDRKGMIELKLYSEGNKAIIRVRDNGCGIPDAMREEIFKPKFTTKSSGSGLGLAISANMIDAIGGRIYFESIENRGTDFFVELPLVRSKYSESTTRISLDDH